jgi:hypothetical protein
MTELNKNDTVIAELIDAKAGIYEITAYLYQIEFLDKNNELRTFTTWETGFERAVSRAKGLEHTRIIKCIELKNNKQTL